MVRRSGVLTIVVLMLASTAGPAFAVGPTGETDWSVDEDRVEVRQSSAAGTVIVVDLPSKAFPTSEPTDGTVPVPPEAQGTAGEAEELLVTVEPNQLCRDAAGLVGQHWDVEVVPGDGGDELPALPETDPDETEIEIEPGELEELQQQVDELRAQVAELRQTLDETRPEDQVPGEAQPWLEAAEAELAILTDRIRWTMQAGQSATEGTEIADQFNTAAGLVQGALDSLEGDGNPAPVAVEELEAQLDEAIATAEGIGIVIVFGPDPVLGAVDTVNGILSGIGPYREPPVSQTVRGTLDEARQTYEEAQGETEPAEQRIQTAREQAEQALAVLGPVETLVEKQTGTPVFEQAREEASPATSALEDLEASIEEAEEDPTQSNLDDAWAYLLLAEDEVNSLLENVDAATTSPPGQVRIFLPQTGGPGGTDDPTDTDPDDADDTDDLGDTDPTGDDPLGDDGDGEDTSLPDDDPDVGDDPADAPAPDPGSLCRAGPQDGGTGDDDDSGSDDGNDSDGNDDEADDGSDDGDDGSGDDGSEGDDGDGSDDGDGGDDGSDDGGDGGDGSDGDDDQDPYPVELSLDTEEIRTGGAEERSVTATVTNPTDETQGYQLVAEDDGPFSVTTQGASEAELGPGESEDFELRVSPTSAGEGELVVRAIADDGSEAEDTVPVTVEATDEHLRVGLSSSNVALGMDETRIIDVKVENTADYDDEVQVTVRTPDALEAAVDGDTERELPAGETATFEVPIEAVEPGEAALEVEVEAYDGSVLQSTVLVDAGAAGDDAETAGNGTVENGTGEAGAPAAEQEEANGVPVPVLATLIGLVVAARRARSG